MKKFRYCLFSPRFRDIYFVVDEVINCLSETELKILEAKFKNKTISFRDQMLMKYFYSYPRVENIDGFKKITEDLVEKNRFIFEIEDKSSIRELFMEKLGSSLFLNHNSYFFEVCARDESVKYRNKFEDAKGEHRLNKYVGYLIERMDRRHIDLFETNYKGEIWGLSEQLNNRFFRMGMKFDEETTKKKIERIVEDSYCMLENSLISGKLDPSNREIFMTKIDDLLTDSTLINKINFLYWRIFLGIIMGILPVMLIINFFTSRG